MYAQPEAAVQSYIDALLCDSLSVPLDDATESSRAAQTESKDSTLRGPSGTVESSDDLTPPESEGFAGAAQSARESIVHEPIDRQHAFVKHLALAQRQSKAGAAANAQYPDWAQDDFDCLVVNVASLKLAIPTSFIDSTIACVPERTLIEPDSILMSCEVVGEQQVVTVDTAKIVMPERYDSTMRSAYCHKILLKDCDFALAVDGVVGEAKYQPRQVRWRGAYTRRFWLAGTVISDMCAVLDIAAIHREVLANQVLDSDGDAS